MFIKQQQKQITSVARSQSDSQFEKTKFYGEKYAKLDLLSKLCLNRLAQKQM